MNHMLPFTEPLTPPEKYALQILTEALTDTGYWSYWDGEPPFAFQVEFEWVQLWNSTLGNAKDQPKSRVALCFYTVHCFEFLLFSEPTAEVPLHWPELMKSDKLPLVTNTIVLFNDKEAIEKELALAKHRSPVFGSAYQKQDHFYEARFQCLVRSGSVGFLLSCNELQWMTNPNERHELVEVVSANKKWWEYWKTYWKHRGTDTAFPYDPNCEITIPLKEE